MDEQGTINYISPDMVARAASLVRTGEVVQLGLPFDSDGPQIGNPNPGRFNPLHFMTKLPTEPGPDPSFGIADDVIVMPLQASTQWDGLAHIAHGGRLYGGRPASEVTSAGARVNSITAISSRIAGRAVLVDMARHMRVDSLDPGQPVHAGDLDAALQAEEVDVGEGDILLVRTGYLQRCRSANWVGWRSESPGLHLDTLQWISDRRVAAVASDNAGVEVLPSPLAGIWLPFHIVAIVYMGLLLGEMFDLERLSQICAGRGQYAFFLVAPPLPVTGGVGSPINPYAIL
jgi:kynurenine formamidase